MTKSEIIEMPKFFDRYIHLAKDGDLLVALKDDAYIEKEIFKGMLAIGDRRYAENKWTVKDIMQHIIDNERIQAYRALRFAREDSKILPGYDEGPYAQSANACRRSLEDLLVEFTLVRESTISLFKSFDQQMLLRNGICFNVKISVLALGFVISGHAIHHFNIIKERYLSLQ